MSSLFHIHHTDNSTRSVYLRANCDLASYILMGLLSMRVQMEDGTPFKIHLDTSAYVRRVDGTLRDVNAVSTMVRFPSLLSCFLPHPTQSTKSLSTRIRHTSVMASSVDKFPRFRVLVIGRANSGKTTLLQRVCNTTESPIVRDQNGKKVTGSLLRRKLTIVH